MNKFPSLLLRKNYFTMVLLLLFSATAFPQNKTYEKINAYMDKQAEINRFGGTVLVMKNDSVILKKAYGYANMEWKVKNTTDTKFVLASITKHFTAIAIMQLIEKNQLSLSSKLNEFFPDYPKGKQVTIHMLLTHTAGLPLDFEDLYMDVTAMPKDTAIAIIQKKPYLFEPGSNCRYSNIGYFLLSQIIEKVTGQTFSNYMHQYIFEKVGMKNSGVSNNDSIVYKKASIYYRDGNSYALNPFINWNLNVGLDGIYSTVEDLYLLDRAMYGTKLLSEKSTAMMHTQYNKKYPDGGFIDSYGYGIFVNPSYNHGHQLYTHSGGFVGTMTTFDRYPEDNIFIAVLSNNESESHIISYGLAGILFDKEVELPYQHTVIQNKTVISQEYAGNYENLKIILSDNNLYLNTLDTPLLQESEVLFFRKDNNDRTFEFLKDKKGKIIALQVTKGGVKEIKKKSLDNGELAFYYFSSSVKNRENIVDTIKYLSK